MKCLNCERETKNPKYCSHSCSTSAGNKSTPKRPKQGVCKKCKQITNKCRVYCKDCRSNNKVTSHCLICGVLKTSENAIPEKGGKYRSYCRSCHLDYESLRRRNNKQIYINYKGGCCQKCGYSKSLSALQFHHIDPTLKEYEISSKNKPGLTDERKIELNKCQLLCANCHAEEHFDRTIKPCVIEYELRHRKQ